MFPSININLGKMTKTDVLSIYFMRSILPHSTIQLHTLALLFMDVSRSPCEDIMLIKEEKHIPVLRTRT